MAAGLRDEGMVEGGGDGWRDTQNERGIERKKMQGQKKRRRISIYSKTTKKPSVCGVLGFVGIKRIAKTMIVWRSPT